MNAIMHLNQLDRRIIETMQEDLPLVARPFAELAQKLKVGEDFLIERLQDLKAASLISRVGPRFDTLVMGGGDSLLALCVPEKRLDRVISVIQRLPEIAHSHVRDHHWNVWCVVMTERRSDVDQVIQSLIRETRIEPMHIPKEQAFTRNRGLTRPPETPWNPDATDRKLILATQSGLPLVPHPFEEVGRWVGLDTKETIRRLAAMKESGIIRSLVAVPNRPELGLVANALCAWNLEDQQVEAFGMKLASTPFVTRCAQRPRISEDWPYNLYATVHGTSKEEVWQRLADIEEAGTHQNVLRETMFNKQVIKKKGLRLTLPTNRG